MGSVLLGRAKNLDASWLKCLWLAFIQTQHRGFARARRAKQRYEFARLDIERHVIGSLNRAEVLAETAKLDECHGETLLFWRGRHFGVSENEIIVYTVVDRAGDGNRTRVFSLGSKIPTP